MLIILHKSLVNCCNHKQLVDIERFPFPTFTCLIMQDLKTEKRSSDLFAANVGNNSNNGGKNGWNGSASDSNADEEAPLIPPSLRMSHLGRQLSGHTA